MATHWLVFFSGLANKLYGLIIVTTYAISLNYTDVMKRSALLFSLLAGFILTSNPSAQAQTRRRISPQAEGAIIGGGVGGAAGAIINKRNRVVGGVIGGLLGGAAGYAIGKHKDNKNKETARIAAAREADRQAAIAAQETAARQRVLAEQEATRRNALAERAAAERAASVDKPTTVAPQMAVLSAAPTAPLMTFGSAATPLPSTNTTYLLNASYGDPTAPYGLSKYRRKSW